jgi:hypothetical protein
MAVNKSDEATNTVMGITNTMFEDVKSKKSENFS